MTTHESVRASLPVAAAGGLSDAEWLQVQQHTGECESCRRELELWGLYAQELRHLPQPTFPKDLLARTHANVLLASQNTKTGSRGVLMYCVLAGYSWVLAFSVWIVARGLTGGHLEWAGTNWVAPAPWILASFVLTSITAGAAAVMLSHRHPARRVS